ncbi:MAG: hypothetical protein HXY34_06490 [Candidatus Thorarchaeota archaeon]|nr:hypothetical protein [Candidatus Thorarchaeota archaeon]
MRYECIQAKSLLSKHITADCWFHTNRSLNAYRGCEHGCVYCDGMAEHYHVEDFTTHIRVKENAAEILRKELTREGFVSRSHLETETLYRFLDEDDASRIERDVPRPIVVGVCGGVSDGFQPAEREHHVTERVLGTLLDFRLPVMVLTKSDYVLQYLDLLKEIHEAAFANVMFTVTLADEEKRRVIEPKASPTPDRFAALKEVRRAGIFGGVMSVPLIPWIGDTDEKMTALAEETRRAGGEFIQFGGLTLKPGRQKEYFLRVIARRFPEYVHLLQRAYSNNDRYGRPDWKQLPCNKMLKGHRIAAKVGIRDRSVRHATRDEPQANVTTLGVLLDIEFYQNYLLGLPWSKSRPFHELAATIERGVPDLEMLIREGRLDSTLHLSSHMSSIVTEIVKAGSCDYLDSLLERLSEEVSGPEEFVAFSDE